MINTFISLFLQKNNIKMAIRLLRSSFFILICFIIIHSIAYYSPAKKLNGLTVIKHNDDTIRVAYIGDSWAKGHEKVKSDIDSIISSATGRIVEIKTAGISGLTSKQIYCSIFRDDFVRNIIEWGPNYCFVVAGINDTDRKLGKKFYKENMRLIIELLLENYITPVVLEIPSYDIHFSFKQKSRLSKLLYLFSMLMTWSQIDCIEEYRKELNGLLEENGWNNKVITIFSKDWNPDGHKDKRNLYDGGLMHLNAKGYHVLDSCIANKIIQHLSVSLDNGNR